MKESFENTNFPPHLGLADDSDFVTFGVITITFLLVFKSIVMSYNYRYSSGLFSEVQYHKNSSPAPNRFLRIKGNVFFNLVCFRPGDVSLKVLVPVFGIKNVSIYPCPAVIAIKPQ